MCQSAWFHPIGSRICHFGSGGGDQELLIFVSADNEIMDAGRSQSRARQKTAGRYSDLFQPRVHKIGYLITQNGVTDYPWNWTYVNEIWNPLILKLLLTKVNRTRSLWINARCCAYICETVWNGDWNDSALINSTDHWRRSHDTTQRAKVCNSPCKVCHRGKCEATHPHEHGPDYVHASTR